MSNRRNNQFTWNPHNKATLIDCAFTVSPTDTAGAGITNLYTGGRIASVYMHTSATPATGNPNPASGLVIVNFQDNYNSFLGFQSSILAPKSGSNISISGSSVLTVGQVYTITSLGSSTQANWVAVGVPSNLTAAVGVSFIASVTGGGTGTGIVQAPAAGVSGIDHLEIIGGPDMMNSNGAIVLGAGNGMQVIFGCYAISSTLTMSSYTPAGTNNSATPPVFTGTPAVLTGTVVPVNTLTAPATNSRIRMAFYLNDSAQGV